METKNIVIAADLHFDSPAVSSRELYGQLKRNFLEPIERAPKIDAVIIAGDVAHAMISMNSPSSVYMTRFMTELSDLARDKDFEVHIIRGTYSHDGNQLDNYYFLVEDPTIKFYIHTHPTVIYIMDDFKTLFLPDGKYTIKEREKIDSLMNDKYDLVFGHGLYDTMKHMHQESENMPTNPYLFSVKKFFQNVAGPVVFGHIHSYTNIDNKVFYTGSFTRLEANLEDCGYMVFKLNTEDKTNYEFSRIINPDSTEFYRVKIKEQELMDFDIHDITKEIDDLLDSMKRNDRLMIKLYLSDKPFVTDKIMLIHERYRNDSRVNITKKITSRETEMMEKKLKDDRAKYSYILDPNIDFNEKLIRYFEEDIKPHSPRYSTIVLTPQVLDRVFKSSQSMAG